MYIGVVKKNGTIGTSSISGWVRRPSTDGQRMNRKTDRGVNIFELPGIRPAVGGRSGRVYSPGRGATHADPRSLLGYGGIGE